MKERLRFAPSPTGYLHVGNVRTALFNWLYCKNRNGSFILRIEDTDPKRCKPEYIQSLMDSLRWLGLHWDEGPDVGGNFGPYLQSQRRELYAQYARILFENGWAFPCFCPVGKSAKIDYLCRSLTQKERSHRMESEPFVLRFFTPIGETISFRDMLRGELTFKAEELGDFPLSRGMDRPLYNFSCVIDDHFMEITLVMRGEDHISNTPKQILLYKVLEWESPRFLHLPLILGEDGAPLSKRHGAVSLEYYRQQGFLPEALRNFLALLGWSPGDEQEFLPTEKLISSFSLERIHKAPARFHFSKLKWLNSKYIQNMTDEEFLHTAIPFLQDKGYSLEGKETLLSQLPSMFRERLETFAELPEKADFFFLPEITISPELREKYLSSPRILSWIQQVISLLQKVEPFTRENLEQVLRKAAQEAGLKPAEAFQPIRVAVSGKDATPGLFDVLHALQKEVVLHRLQKAISP
ncbi:MAG: glutamate--tRNA ligase [bacterium JZ-2024 1]